MRGCYRSTVDSQDQISILEQANKMTSSSCRVRSAVIIIAFAFFLVIKPFDVSAQSEDREAVRNLVERFLTAVGDGDLDLLPEMFVSNANIGTAGMRDGSWVTSTMTFEEWMSSLRARTPWTRFREPVSEFTIHVESSMMAFVRADATVVRDGQARSRNIDYFTLVREDGSWKFLSASYVARPIESN
jgi:ketosteroid isomerase-like protein